MAGSSLTDSVWPILTYWITDSPFVTSLTVLSQVLPHLLFGLLAGVQVDKSVSKRGFLLYPNIISGIAFMVAALLGANSYRALLIALCCYFVSECAAIYYSAAIPAILPRIVAKEQLAAARSTFSVIVNILTFALPGVSVFVLSRFGARPLFIVDALSFLSAALVLNQISERVLNFKYDSNDKQETQSLAAKTSPTQSLRSILTDMGAGFKYLWRQKDVRLLTLAGVLNAACGGAVLSLYVVLLRDTLGYTKNDLRIGLFVYAITLGAILGGLIFPKVKQLLLPINIAMLFLLVNGGAVLALSCSSVLVLSLLAITIYQASYSVIINNAIVLRMEVVAEAYLGRVAASGRFISWGAAPVGALVGGGLISSGVSSVIVLASCAVLPFLAAGFLGLARKQLR